MAVEDSTAPKFKEQDLQLWQLMIAGSVAGSFKNMTMFPVRTLDQRMLHRSYSQRHVGIRQALRSVIQTEGPSALYRGIWYMRHGAMGPAQFVHFSFYDVSKNFLSTGNPNNPVVHVISWAFTVVWSYAVSTPVDMAKLRYQNGFGNYKGVWDCAKRVTHEEGITSSLFQQSALLLVCPDRGEAAKRKLIEISPKKKNWWLVHATAGATAGGLAVALTWPLGIVAMTLSQPTGPSKHVTRVSLSHVFVSFVKYEGFMPPQNVHPCISNSHMLVHLRGGQIFLSGPQRRFRTA
ncbi:hypothetical protein AXX17_AT1G06650 [Arabidopsis thaliana]|uniref:Mitochondrial carrier protein n=1 Tax=Arabidopsis thaliana TaxID=3702 RepID=A0A178WDL8_ARATH|nr:hypothetical protein AXX17_AT1G06650 [Arabidopsis thaliana]